MLHASSPPDPWAGYRRCLEDLPEGFSHVLIIQDDAIPALNFVPALERVAAKHPDTPVCLWMSGIPSGTAVKARRMMQRAPHLRYLPLGPSPFVPAVAILWPTAKARDLHEWAADWPRLSRADDGNISKWVQKTKQNIIVTVPSMVEHDEHEPSVKGGRQYALGDSQRTALFTCLDAATLDW